MQSIGRCSHQSGWTLVQYGGQPNGAFRVKAKLLLVLADTLAALAHQQPVGHGMTWLTVPRGEMMSPC